MKKAALAILLTISLAGCASLPHPNLHRRHKPVAAAPVPVAPPPVIVAPAPPPAPPTFNERFQAHWKKLKWVH